MASRYCTRSSARANGCPKAQFSAPMPPSSEDGSRASQCHVAGTKRNSSKFLPPLPPSSASRKRLTRQRSDSCLSGVSTASGALSVQNCPAAVTLTPNSAHAANPSCATEGTFIRATGENHQASLDCSMTDTNARCLENAARSPSSTDITFQSRMRCDPASTVNCEEELEDDDDEVRGCVQSKARCEVDAASLPQWIEAVECAASAQCPHDPCEPEPAAWIGEEPKTLSQPPLEQCGAYEEDIFFNMRQVEMSRKPAWGYLSTTQTELVVDHRRIMINWLVEFAEEFALESETLFLCVAILDQFLLRGPPVKKGSLQLLGTACMLIAVKFQECHPPNMMESCCAAAEGSFTRGQIVSMEGLVLKTIGYSCAMPTTLVFLWHHLKEVQTESGLSKLSEYLSMLTLSEYDLLKYYPSALSAASVLLAGLMLGRDGSRHLHNMRSEYSFGDLKPIMSVILELFQKAPTNPYLTSTWRKFSREESLSAASLTAASQGLSEGRTEMIDL